MAHNTPIPPLSLLPPLARACALFLALFTLLNIAGDYLSPGFDSNIWWIDLRPLPRPLAHLALAAASLGLLAVAANQLHRPVLRRLAQCTTAALLLAAVLNVATFYLLFVRGIIRPGMPIPFSLLLAITLGLILRHAFLPQCQSGKLHRLLLAATFAACLILFPLAQIFCFGMTDYRRPADAIVVFGALTYKNGSPSQALADRVNTAVELYKKGLAPTLIFTGGPSFGPISEPQAMRTIALSQGIPDTAIILDEAGLHTDASVQNTAAIFESHHFHTILAVSHFYHLPRIKMSYDRALHDEKQSIEVLTVPVQESAPLVAMPRFIIREVAALWAYYLRPLEP
jgi:vancomycin permeability regulator SanA